MATDHNFRIKNGLTVGSVEVIDSSGKLTANAFGTNSNEKIEDVVADMITGATHSNITVTYNDTNGTLAFAAAAQYGDSDVESYLDTNGLTIPDNIKANFGADDDLEIYHSSSNGHSYIHHTKAAQVGFPSIPSDLIIKGNYIRIQNEDGDDLFTATSNTTGGTRLYHEGSLRLETKNQYGSRNLDVEITGNTDVDGILYANGLRLNDSEYLYLGTSDDMRLYHDGTNSIINNQTGVLYIDQNVNDGNLILRSDNGSGGLSEYIVLDGGSGSTKLKHYGSTKFETTSSGISVTGNITATTVNTGHGDNELYAMNQNVRTTDSPTFGGLTLNGGVDFNGNNINDINQINGSGATGWLDFNMDTDSVYPQASTDNQTVLGSVTHMNFVGDSNGNGTGGIFYWGYGVDSSDSGTFTQTMALDRSGNLTAIGQGKFASLDVDGIIDNTYNNGNVAAPNNSDHTAGTRIKFYDASSTAWYAMGIESNTLWFNSDNKYKWYEDSTIRMTLDGANLTVTGSVTASTINTGQGATEVHLMNQNVRTSDSPTFADLTVTGNLNITGDINSYNVTDLDVTDKTITVGVGGSASTNDGAGLVVDGASASILWENSFSQFRINKSVEANGFYTEDQNGTVASRFGIYGWDNELQFTKRNLSTNVHTGTLMSLDYSNNNAKFLGAIYPSGQSTNYVDSTRITNWQAAYNDKINSASFNTGNGIITLNQQDGGTVTVDIDGRFLTSYSETDTLATVVSRGASTSNTVTMTGGIIGNSFRVRRQDNNGTIWFNGSSATDTNHALWNAYYGTSPTTRGAANSGFDGIYWNTYRGIHIRGGLGGAVDCIKVTNSSGSNTDHTVTLYASNVARLATNTSGISVTGNIAVSGTVDGRDVAADGTKLDTIATNADVTPSWVPSSNPNYAYYDHFRSLGTQAFTAGGGSNNSTTTSALIGEMEGDGAFDSYTSAFKTSWSYATNDNLSDAGRFTETAGTSFLTWTDNSNDSTRGNITVLAIAPNTGGSAGKMFVYNDQGSGYAPGWREIWTSTSDGASSGLDADLLDGQEGSYYLNYNNLTNTPTIPNTSNFLTSNANDVFGSTSSNQYIRFNCNSGQYIASGGSSSRFPIEIYAPTANGGDAGITFHIDNDYAGFFGLASDWNDLAWGGWSVGSTTKHRILHTGNYSAWNRDDRYYTESESDGKYLLNTSDQLDGTLTIQSGGANTYGRIRGYPNDNHFIAIRGSVATGSSTLSITGAHRTTFVEHAENNDTTGWYFTSKQSGNYTEIMRITRTGGIIHSDKGTGIFSGNIGSYAASWKYAFASNDGTNNGGNVTAGSTQDGIYFNGTNGITTSASGSTLTLSGANLLRSNADDTTVGTLTVNKTNDGIGLIVTRPASGNYGGTIVVGASDVGHTLVDGNRRPAVIVDGQYPVLNLNHTATSNDNHGPTIQFSHNDYNSNRQWVIGTDGQGQRLDFGVSGGTAGSNTDKNPHRGIAGYNGVTIARMFESGVLIGNTGVYPNEVTAPNAELDVRGSLYVEANTDETSYSGVHSHVIRTTGNSGGGNGAQLLVQNDRGNHSWGTVAEFRINTAGDTDNPSIIFTSAAEGTNTWGIGYGYTDTNFRINRDHGHLNSNWGVAMMTLDRSGNATFAGNVTAYSDERLKENIETIPDAIETVKKIRGVTFDWKETGEEGMGVIAQEIEAVPILKRLVNETPKDGVSEFAQKNVAYGNMVGLLIEAVKEQQEQIEELKSIINTLMESK